MPLNIICCVIGKPVREGGWDMVKREPRPLNSYVPAGSCYFCIITDPTLDIESAQNQLHGINIGQEVEYGRGELLAGYW